MDGSNENTRPKRRQRRALVVGINYSSCANKALALRGCVSDAQRLHAFLQSQATPDAPIDITLLCDEPVALENSANTTVLSEPPTRAVLERALRDLVRDADANTSLWFSYSGHGSNERDRNGDERDGRDEALVPVDCDVNGLISDDWLRANIVDALPAGAQLTCLVDACHSATAFDLPVTIEDVSVHKRGAREQRKVSEYRRADWRRVQRRIVYDEMAPTSADVMTVSGCRDAQTSADAVEDDVPTGALTHAFLLFAKTAGTPSDLLQDMSTWLRVRGYTQRPILSFGAELGALLDALRRVTPDAVSGALFQHVRHAEAPLCLI